VLAAGLWNLSGVVVISFANAPDSGEVVLGYERAPGRPRLAVISGGAGLLILASLGRVAERLACITPVQDPVEYYYRASSLFHFENVIFVVPTPAPLQVDAELDDGTRVDIKENITPEHHLAARHAESLQLRLPAANVQPIEVTQVALDAIAEADAIILGPPHPRHPRGDRAQQSPDNLHLQSHDRAWPDQRLRRGRPHPPVQALRRLHAGLCTGQHTPHRAGGAPGVRGGPPDAGVPGA
jgi:hypothetical protein